MKRLLFGTLGALLLVGVASSCVEDPTSGLRGDVVRVLISRTFVQLDVGDVLRLNAKAFDAQGNVVGVLPDISVSDANVVSFIVDDTTSGDPLPQTDFQISADAPGSVTITATAGGVTSDPTLVLSFPTSFPGTVTPAASGMGWDVITVSSTADLKFDPDHTTATIAGYEAYIHSITADELQLVHSDPAAVAAGTISIEDLVFLGEYDISSLDATVDVAAFDPSYMTTDIATAPELSAGPFPLIFYGMVDGTNYDRIVKFSPAADLTLASSVYWADHDTDIDVFYTTAGDGFIDCLGCGGSNPETGTFTVAGGDTNHYYVELWSGNPTVFQVTLSVPPAP